MGRKAVEYVKCEGLGLHLQTPGVVPPLTSSWAFWEEYYPLESSFPHLCKRVSVIYP